VTIVHDASCMCIINASMAILTAAIGSKQALQLL